MGLPGRGFLLFSLFTLLFLFRSRLVFFVRSAATLSLHPHSRDRILCLIPVTQKTLQNAIVLSDVMEDRCDGLKFFSHDKSLPAFIGKYKVYPLQTTPGLKFWDIRREIAYGIWAHLFDRPELYVNYEYFAKFGDARHIFIPENFKLFAARKKLPSDTPLYLGHTLEHKDRKYIYGLGVYVINRVALEIIGPLVHQLAQGNRRVLGCLHVEYKPEDDFAGFCLEELGIIPGDTRDREGREFFLIFQARDHYQRMDRWREDWYWKNKSPANVASDCCASDAIVFGNYNGELFERCLRIFYARGDLTVEALHEIQVQVG